MTCPACEGPAEPWRRVRGGEPTDSATYELFRCRVCGTAVTAGADPGRSAYSTGVYAGRPPRLAGLVGVLQRLALRLPRRALARAGVSRGASVLDAGAGTGRLVTDLREHGYRAEGIDPSPRGEGIEPTALGEHVAHDLDAVVLWHVLEHVPDPSAAVARTRDWLRPGGVLIVGVPNLASLQARLAGPAWFHLDLPRHRTHFTTKGLRSLMSRAAIRPERTYRLVPEHNFHGMWFALLSRLGMTPGFPFHLLKRNAPARLRDVLLLVVAGPLLLLPALVLELAATAFGCSGSVVVVGRTHAA